MAQAMTERCYRTEGLPQDTGACRGRFRAAALWAAHLSVTLRVPPLLKERPWPVRSAHCVTGISKAPVDCSTGVRV